jgi:uncharacterized protein with FMN-binding domain
MSKIKKRVLIIVGVVVLIGLAIGTKYLMDVQNYKNEVAAMQINNINLADIPDGSYLGAYDVNFIKVKVKVDVQDHWISNIELIQHENGKGTPAEAIVSEVIKAQSLDVDTVSGATNSSRVILKTIEIALESTKI